MLILGFTSAMLASSPERANAETLGSWTSTTSYPVRTNPVCVASGSYLYCLGGASSNDVKFALISSSGVGSWTATTSYPTAISGESCTTAGGYIYCVSGINGSLGPRPTDSVYYAPLSSSGVGPWTKTTNYPVGVIG